MSAKIKNIILKVQELVTKAIYSAIGQAKAFAKKVGNKQELKAEPNKEIQASEEIWDGQVGKEIRFDPNGEGHRLWIDVQGTSVTVMVASKSGPLKVKIEEWKRRLLDDQFLGEKRSKAESLLRIADDLLDIIEKKGQEAAQQKQRAEQEPTNLTAKAQFIKANNEVLQAEEDLANIVKPLFELFVGAIRIGGMKYILDDVLFKRIITNMNPLVSQTSLMAHYTGLDGKPKYVQNKKRRLGKVIKNEYNMHAEKVFIADYFPLIIEDITKYHQANHQKGILFITLNRTSCGKENKHDCTGELVKKITESQDILSMHIEFAAAYAKGSEYSGNWQTKKLSEKAKERIEEVIIRLLDAGALVYATTLWRDIQQTEYFKSISSKNTKRNVERFAIYEQILDEIVQNAYRKSSPLGTQGKL